MSPGENRTGECDWLIWDTGFEIEEEIGEVESEVMVRMADMWLEETRTLRNCRLPLFVDWW